jgi:hypothetical protein
MHGSSLQAILLQRPILQPGTRNAMKRLKSYNLCAGVLSYQKQASLASSFLSMVRMRLASEYL